MDAFKFAFETLIVGLLALPWLALMISLILPGKLFRIPEAGEEQPAQFPAWLKLLDPTALAILTVAGAYFLGSAISPLAEQLLDDPDMRTVKIRDIRARIYGEYLGWLESKHPVELKGNPAYANSAAELVGCEKAHGRSGKQCWDYADRLFLLQENVVLKQGTDKTERVSRLHERVIVLRGAVFNSFAFFILCLYGFLSRNHTQPFSGLWSSPMLVVKTLLKTASAATIAFFLIGTALHLGSADLFQHDITDPPIMEGGLLGLGIIGVIAMFQGVVARPYLLLLVGGFIFTALAYGGWLWTEIVYTENVIAAFFAI